LIEVLFLTKLPSNTGISVWRTAWVTTNCCFLSDILSRLPLVLDHTNGRKREWSVSDGQTLQDPSREKRYAVRMENMKSTKRMRNYF